MKPSIIRLIIAALTALGLACNAKAIAVFLTPATSAVATGPESSTAQINTIIAGLIGNSVELFKTNVGTGDEGTFAGSYNTSFSNGNHDGVTSYAGSPNPIIGPTAYYLLKDGNADPNWYLFNLTNLGWTGTENITFTGFFPTHSISHVTIYSSGASVPDGGSTVAYLGGALMLLAGAARRSGLLAGV